MDRTWRDKECPSFFTSSTGARTGENSCAPATLFLPHQHRYSVTPCPSSETFTLAETQLQNKNDLLLRAGLYLAEQGQTHTSPHVQFNHRARSSITISCRHGVLPWPLWSHLHPPTSTRRREVDLLHCPGIGSRPRQLQDANKNVPCLADSPQSAQ